MPIVTCTLIAIGAILFLGSKEGSNGVALGVISLIGAIAAAVFHL